jgi:hypothetical protein
MLSSVKFQGFVLGFGVSLKLTHRSTRIARGYTNQAHNVDSITTTSVSFATDRAERDCQQLVPIASIVANFRLPVALHKLRALRV